MPRTSQQSKDTSFNLRIDPTLKAAFTAAAEAEHQPAAEAVSALMCSDVKQREHRAFEAEARRQSLSIAERACDPNSDEYAVLRELEAALQQDDFADEWKA